MLHKHLFATSVFVAAAVIVTGCSSVDVKNQEVSVSSTPDDATVSINGKVMSDTTNTSFTLPRESNYVIVVSKTGYLSATVQIQPLPTGAEAEGLPRFQLSSTNIKVTLDEDPFAAVEALSAAIDEGDAFAEVEALSAAAAAIPENAPVPAADTAKINRLAEEKLAREHAEARAVAEAKAAAEKQAAADIAAENTLATQSAKEEAIRLAAQQAAAKKIADEEAAAVIAAEKAAAATPVNADTAKLEAELKAAKEKIALLEQQKAAPAPAAAPSAPSAAPVVNQAPAASDILARYKTLRTQLKNGEITQAEYNASIAKLKR